MTRSRPTFGPAPAGRPAIKAPPAPVGPLIHVRGLHAASILRSVDLDVSAGEVVAVAGPPGAGRGELLRHVAGLRIPDRGDVVVAGRSIVHASTREHTAHRRRAAYVHDDIAGHDVAAAMRATGDGSGSSWARDPARIAYSLGLVGLDERVLPFRPAWLGLAVRRRLAIARAILGGPDILLLDRPFRGLDLRSAGRLADVILQVRDALGATVLVSVDEPELLYALADRVVALKDGRVVFDGATASFVAAVSPRSSGIDS